MPQRRAPTRAKQRAPDHAKSGKNGGNGAGVPGSHALPPVATEQQGGVFARFAAAVARLSGRPATFLAALAIVIIWGISGPVFQYSDTWQLVINTGTTIVTFLMVFLIQNSQNREALAVQIKLSELIIAMRGAHNQVAAVEHLGEDELEDLHREYQRRAEMLCESLAERRKAKPAKA